MLPFVQERRGNKKTNVSANFWKEKHKKDKPKTNKIGYL